MSKNLLLCGHTGSDNRGCEAIVRSTIKVLTQAGLETKPMLASYMPGQDINAGLPDIAEITPYHNYSSKLQRYFYGGMRKLMRNPLVGQNIVHKEVWNKLDSIALSFAIGGDTYCYNVPTGFVAHNQKMKKAGIPSVLWCCSIGEEYLNAQVKKDLENYSLIVVREAYTYENLMNAGISKDKVIRCCDPAFRLNIKECELPAGFVESKTIGLNLSGFVNNEATMAAAENFVEKILSETDMSICLVPHVYAVEPETEDLKLLRKFREKFSGNDRVSLVEKALSCEELKYIISKCRFFVGARTHSTIAAYSTGVPTLVLGYSIKSRGIAKDLFGTDKGYVVPFTDIKEKDDIWQAFTFIMENETNIKEILSLVLPEYTQTVQDVADMIYNRYLR